MWMDKSIRMCRKGENTERDLEEMECEILR